MEAIRQKSSNKLAALAASATLLAMVAAPASAIVFSQTETGTIVFDPAAGNGTTDPGAGGPLTLALNFGGYLGTPGDLAGETLVAVALEWEAAFVTGSQVSITNNAAGSAFVGVSEVGTHSIVLPNVTQTLSVSAANGTGAFIAPGTTVVNPLLADEATTDSTVAVSPYLTDFVLDDIVATISVNFSDTLFSSQPPTSIVYDFLLNDAQSVTLTYVSEAVVANIPVPASMLLMLGGLGLVARGKRAQA